MELQIMGQSQFEDVVALTRLMYEAKDRLLAAGTLKEKVAIKKEIAQLANERDTLQRA